MTKPTSTNVITHDRFTSADRIKQLKDDGVAVVHTGRRFNSCREVEEPQYGETIIGELTRDERQLFYNLYDTSNEFEDMSRTLMGQMVSKLGDKISKSDRNTDLSDMMEDESHRELAFDTPEDSETFYRLEKKRDMLHATFHWVIAERLGVHDHVLGVRTKGRVVQVKRRY